MEQPNTPTQTQLDNQKAIAEDSQVVELDNPIKFGEQTLTSITIRKPNVRALYGTKIADLLQGDVTAICTILPRISEPNLTKTQIDQLEPADLAQISGVIMLFLQQKSVRAQILQQQ